ncbi:hypothetical protein [Caulobacter sp. LARHSG274]
MIAFSPSLSEPPRGQIASAEGLPRSAQLAFLIVALNYGVIVLFQKFGYSTDAASLSITLPCLIVSFVALMILGDFRIAPIRLIAYAAFCATAFFSQAMVGRGISWFGMAILFAIYLFFVFEMRVTWGYYLRTVAIFQNLMLIACALLLLQHLWQFTLGANSIFNIEKYIPTQFFYKTYNYIQLINWRSQYIKPNAFIFLEASIASQFLAIALIAETVYFQRLWRLTLYGACLVLTFAGTGLLIVALTAPLLLLKLSPRRAILLAVASLVLVAIVAATGWFDLISSRFGEFQIAGSSSNSRFIAPFLSLSEAIREPSVIFKGVGAGNIKAGQNIVWWASTKLVVEYGVLTTISFYTLLCISLFDRAPSYRLAWGLFVLFNFMGGYLAMPVMAGLLLLMGCLFRPVDAKPQDFRAALREAREGLTNDPPPLTPAAAPSNAAAPIKAPASSARI